MNKPELEKRLQGIINDFNDRADLMKMDHERQLRLLASLIPLDELKDEDRKALCAPEPNYPYTV